MTADNGCFDAARFQLVLQLGTISEFVRSLDGFPFGVSGRSKSRINFLRFRIPAGNGIPEHGSCFARGVVQPLLAEAPALLAVANRTSGKAATLRRLFADIGNIPFISENANTVSLDSVFSIERVAGPDDTEYMQLQYSQTAQIEFRGMSFPHVTVGTLIKAF